MKALVVDPSATARRIAARALEALGCEQVIEAANGDIALDLADPEIRIVLTEWTLPGLSGSPWIERLRDHPDLTAAAITVLTRSRNREDVRQAAQSGVGAYLLKPIAPDRLRERLATVLGATAEPEEQEADGEPAQGADTEGSPQAESGQAEQAPVAESGEAPAAESGETPAAETGEAPAADAPDSSTQPGDPEVAESGAPEQKAA